MLIVDTFQITGRGLVVVTDQATDLPIGKALTAIVTRPDGSHLRAAAYKEWFLRHIPEPMEKEAFLLTGLLKADIPLGSHVQVEVAPMANL